MGNNIYVQADGNMVYVIKNKKTLEDIWADGKRVLPLVEVTENDIFMVDDQERFELAIEDEDEDNGIEIGSILDFSEDELRRALFVKVHGVDLMSHEHRDKYEYCTLYSKYFPKDTIDNNYTPDERRILEDIKDDNERYCS